MVKKYFRTAILAFSLLFIIRIIWLNNSLFSPINLSCAGILLLILALFITIIAHVWSGYIWYIILRQLRVKNIYIVRILLLYLESNIYKYIPGNVGHFYVRIATLEQAGQPFFLISLSVLLEPILMALAALLVGVFSLGVGLKEVKPAIILTAILVSCLILFSLQPSILNRLLLYLEKVKKMPPSQEKIQQYPLLPLLGEMVFVLLRGGGFLLTAAAFNLSNYRELLGAFSLAWLCGLVIPGLPGGVGVFEAVLIALLNTQQGEAGTVIHVVAIFRIISLAAEIIAAGVAKVLSLRLHNQ